jgi:uncharacterized protein (DUF1501 family)
MKHSTKCTGFESPLGLDRRSFLNRFGGGLGGLALANMLHAESGNGLHHAAKAKRIIYLFQSGGPSQIEETGKELPDSVRKGQRLTGMSGNQASLPLVGSPFKFTQHGKSGQWMSDLLPHTAKVADDMCIVNSMYTEAINHGPGVTFMQTGSQFPGRPSMGAWLSYGLGSMNDNLPSFVTLVTKNKGGQPLVSRLWGSGFLPGKHAGTRFRADKDAILYLNSPTGVSTDGRRKMLDRLKELHEIQLEKTGDPALETRIAQYEMGFRMQSSIPEVTDLAKEPDSTFKLYGEDARKPGTFAANCLLARRLAEKDVRFIQLYHPGWDQHGGLPGGIRRQCKETDQASAALVADLKQRGMLKDTLVIWGGEFGRTNYCQGKFNANNFGRDHHPRNFSTWFAGGGVKGGTTYGKSDDYSYNVAENGVHIHDFHATILHLLGIDHERLTHRYQGRYFRLTDVHGHVVKPILA